MIQNTEVGINERVYRLLSRRLKKGGVVILPSLRFNSMQSCLYFRSVSSFSFFSIFFSLSSTTSLFCKHSNESSTDTSTFAGNFYADTFRDLDAKPGSEGLVNPIIHIRIELVSRSIQTNNNAIVILSM